MILQLVTDRRRLAPQAPGESARDCLVDQARAAAAAGLDIVQVRERDLDGGPLAELVRAVLAVTRGTGTRVVVNDRVDVALATGADGVHLRSDSMEATHVRQIAPAGFLIGLSVHSEDEARVAGPVSYLVAGTIWPTESKPTGHALLGTDGLSRIVAAVHVPVLAIGGVQLSSIADLAAAGAAGVAAVGAWMGIEGPCRAIPLDDRVRAFRAEGDAANMGTHLPAV